MVKIILQAIKMAPRLLWQMYIQPSKVYDFVRGGKDNVYIYTWAFFFSGLLIGIVTAIPHYFLYGEFYQSILFAFALAGAFAFASAGAFAGAFAEAEVFAFAFAFVLAGVFAFVLAGAFALTGAVAVAGAVAIAGAGGGMGAFSVVTAFVVAVLYVGLSSQARAAGYTSSIWSFLETFLSQPGSRIILILISILLFAIYYLIFKRKIKIKKRYTPFLFALAILLLLLVGEWEASLKSYEVLLYPFSFGISYMITAHFVFYSREIGIKLGIFTQTLQLQKYGKFQKSSLFWGPLITIFIILIAISEKITLTPSLQIIALGFLVIPLIISHVPDYLILIPLWLKQKRNILGSLENKSKSLRAYEGSILFKHELLYFQLPGLDKIMVSFAQTKDIGIEEAVKRLSHLYLHTFQQKQALKSVIEILEDKALAHQLFLILSESSGIPLIKKLSKTNRLAELYMMLEKGVENEKLSKSTRQFELKMMLGKIVRNEKLPKTIRLAALNIKIAETLEKEKLTELYMMLEKTVEKEKLAELDIIFNRAIEIDEGEIISDQEELAKQVNRVRKEMEKQEGYRFNKEMIKTFQAVHGLLKSGNLNDISAACTFLEGIKELPGKIKYFSFIEMMAPKLKKVKGTFQKIDTIERMESRRSILSDQKQNIEALLKEVEEKDLFEPLKHIWASGLKRCVEIIEKEVKLLQGAAVLSIDLKNKSILASEEERNLYFEISNKGNELAIDVSIRLKKDIPIIEFPGSTYQGIAVVESGTVKEISFPVNAQIPGKTTVKGTLTFSDRAMEGKKVDFSFPVTILKKSAEFKEIKNPYIVGQPLKGDALLFFGREDAYEFIDNNILASGAHHTIVCHGLRRTGKTSLLYRIGTQGLTDKRLVPINIDMQGIDDEKDFYYTLSNAVVEKLSLYSASPVKNFNQFKRFLKDIKPGLNERIIVLMVDEFEELQMRVEEKKISKSVFSNIRHLMQHEEKLIFLFCGTHQLEEMSADYWSIFFNTAIYFRISHLKREDAIRLIKEPVKNQLTYDDLAVEQILKMTNGQPYLTQLICRTLVNDLNENKKRNDALIDDVDDVVEHIINEGKEHFSQHIWDESSQLEHLILSAAAEELTHKQLDHVGPDAIFDKIKPLLPDFSRKQSMEALDKLVSKEILAERNLRYWFPVNLLRKWIAARYPLRKVREEI